MVKHEDIVEGRDKESRGGNGHQDYEDEYGSDSSEEDVEVPLSATTNARQPSTNYAANGNAQASYSDYLSSDNRTNGTGSAMLSDHSSSNQAFGSVRRVSFGHDMNSGGPNGTPIPPLQGQGLHQSDPHHSQYQSIAHGQQAYGNPLNATYTNGMQSAHSVSFPLQSDHPAQHQYPSHGTQQPHVQSHHAESSVRFIPGLLSAVHGDTPTPSPPNGYRQGNGGHQQANGNIDHSHQQRSHHLSMMSSAPGLASTLASFTSTSSGRRPSPAQDAERNRIENALGASTTSQVHAQPHEITNGRHSESHPLSLAHAASHGLVSSGYSISLSAPNGMHNGSLAKQGSEYDGSQHRSGEQRVGAGNTWVGNGPARPELSAHLSHSDQPHHRADTGYDPDTGLTRRDYAGLDPHASAEGGVNGIDLESGMIGGEDIGKDVGPGVGSVNSGGTTASLKALKMDLGEEGHDAANE